MEILNPIEKRIIDLPKGGQLEVELTEKIIDVIRHQFQIPNEDPIEDVHVRMYIYGAVKSALDKSIREK